MEEMVNTGVNESVAAEQTQEQTTQVETTTQQNTGVENKPDAGANEKVEKAFAARLKEATEKAKQEARDAYIAEQNMEWNGKPIKTEAEYKEAVKEAELRKKYSELPQEIVEELIESRKDREERKAEKLTKAEQDKKNAEYTEFFDYFKTETGRDFDSAKDIIPQEVWDLTNKGKTLTDAYAQYHAKQLKAKIAEYEAKMQALEVNKANAESSPGSVTGNGSAKDDHISFETYEANKHDQAWVNKNFNKIMSSRSKW